MPTTVVNVKGRGTVDYTYIGRQMPGGYKKSPFQNPYKIGTPGIPTVKEAVINYYNYIISASNKAIFDQIPFLKDKKLGCWCKKPDGTGLCHGDVLVYIADLTPTKELADLFAEHSIALVEGARIIDSDCGGPPEVAPHGHPMTAAVAPRIPSIPAGAIPPGKEPNVLDLDRVMGMICGAFLGDSLGVPHEFASDIPYTGRFDQPYRHKSMQRFVAKEDQSVKVFALGQYSDDTEMAIALMRSLIKVGGYNPRTAVSMYIHWASSGQVMMGSNTRALFKGSKVGSQLKEDTYIKHYQKAFGALNPYEAFTLTTPQAENQQSNGALMRCTPLACLGNGWKVSMTALRQDCWLTNPSMVCFHCEYIYLQCVRLLLMKQKVSDIWTYALKLSETAPDPVKYAFSCITERKTMPFVTNTQGKKVKGWVVIGFYCAMMCLSLLASDSPPSYEDCMRWVISNGGDTDTNACIAGGLVGAAVGYDVLAANPQTMQNLNTMMASTSGAAPTEVPRPPDYQLVDLIHNIQQIHNLGSYLFD